MANRPTRTPAKDDVFFGALAAGDIIIDAADKAEYARASVYEWRKSDTAFSARWDESVEAAIQRLEKEADRRAHEGEPELILHKGAPVMVDDGKGGKVALTVRKRSDVLLIFRLKALRPEIYRERMDMRGEVNVTFGLADRLEQARRRAKKTPAK